MATIPDAAPYPIAYQIFAAAVANGAHIRQASESAGFNPEYGFQLVKRPEIADRIKQMQLQLAQEQSQFGGIVSKPWIEASIVSLIIKNQRDTAAVVDDKGTVVIPGRNANDEFCLHALMSLAKFKGYIVQKTQGLQARVDLAKVGRAELTALLGEHAAELAPADQARIKAISEGKARVEVEADSES